MVSDEEISATVVGDSTEIESVCSVWGGGGKLPYKRGGKLVGNFQLNPWPKGDRSGRGPGFF